MEDQLCGMRHCSHSGEWSSWLEWGSCSSACGHGSQARTRYCDHPSPIFNGLTCVGKHRDSRSCIGADCHPVGHWVTWSSWSACSKTCGHGAWRNRKRGCSKIAHAKCYGLSSEKEYCPFVACPVTGHWSHWEWWSSCSKTCGGGKRTRRRACTHPTSRFGGHVCTGKSVVSKSCNKHQCPVNGGWSSWGAWGGCSKTCGGGVEKRKRSCSRPKPSHGGHHCAGWSHEAQQCKHKNCPVNGHWSSWLEWSSCTRTCGHGKKTRHRTCNNPSEINGGHNCHGHASSTIACNDGHCPVNGGWTLWGHWAGCSKTCGGGTRTRSRSCSHPIEKYGGKTCPGVLHETSRCSIHECPIHGEWSMWEQWGSCSKTCGSGTKKRGRSCSAPAPAHGGKTCLGSTEDKTECDTQNCPTDGGWSSWNSWSKCSKTCGGGSSMRMRACSHPYPNHGGSQCEGRTMDKRSCGNRHCAIQGSWGEWMHWTTCTKTCNGGTQRRSRHCSHPRSEYGGMPCVGQSTVNRFCNTHSCPVNGGWMQWSEWSECSKTCGTGFHHRTRICNHPTPYSGGHLCSGTSMSRGSCKREKCPLDGHWGVWSAWTQCSKKCGGGTKIKYRHCTHPHAMFGGLNCLGAASITHECNAHECSANGEWSRWSSWGSCSKTCNGGRRQRYRVCNHPMPLFHGHNCVGSKTSSEVCHSEICAARGAWASWSQWSHCTVTCGGGYKQRHRACDHPTPRHGGPACIGISSDKMQCSSQMCRIRKQKTVYVPYHKVVNVHHTNWIAKTSAQHHVHVSHQHQHTHWHHDGIGGIGGGGGGGGVHIVTGGMGGGGHGGSVFVTHSGGSHTFGMGGGHGFGIGGGHGFGIGGGGHGFGIGGGHGFGIGGGHGFSHSGGGSVVVSGGGGGHSFGMSGGGHGFGIGGGGHGFGIGGGHGFSHSGGGNVVVSSGGGGHSFGMSGGGHGFGIGGGHGFGIGGGHGFGIGGGHGFSHSGGGGSVVVSGGGGGHSFGMSGGGHGFGIGGGHHFGNMGGGGHGFNHHSSYSFSSGGGNHFGHG